MFNSDSTLNAEFLSEKGVESRINFEFHRGKWRITVNIVEIYLLRKG
jgi:hypothetical protein